MARKRNATGKRRTSGKRRTTARTLTGLSLVSLLMAAAAVVGVGAPPAWGYPYTNVVLVGHGWGPGIGMGQWGALGDALDGATYQQILLHFYGQTTSGPATLATLPAASEATDIRVALVQNDGNFTIVSSDSPFSVAGVSFAAGQAAEIVPASASAPSGATGRTGTSGATSGTGFDVFQGPGCAGPWPSTPVASAVANPTAVPAQDPPLGAPGAASQVLQLCQAGGNLEVRGDIEATTNAAGQLRTVNILPLEQYVAGVVPNESPSGWGSLGGPGPQGHAQGFQELEAQAVAARSYVMSDLGGWGGYADICDTTCQSYRGIADETALTDEATMDSAGVVVMMPDGSVATTFYSSSTGGYTAPSQFVAVPDPGDAVCVAGACNPHHTWQAQIPVTTIEAAYPAIGTLLAVDVTRRNGYGDFGGRVLDLSLEGSSGSVSLSGYAFANRFGLQSNWFSVASQPSGGISGYWLAGIRGGVFSFGNAHFYGSMGGKPLDKPIVGIAATPDGGGYWEVASDGGVFSFGNAHFYGSLPGMSFPAHAVALLPTATGKGYLIVTAGGRTVELGDAPQFGQVAGSVDGWASTLVGGAMVDQ